MDKTTNPFAIRKSPVGIISVQAASLDDYAKRLVPDIDPGTPGRKCLSGM
jgi:hypothetical protein